MTNSNQLKGAAEEMTAASTVTSSGDDCDSGNNGSGNNGSSDDGGCSDGNGNTDGGSGGVNGDCDGGNCNSNGIAVAMVKAMTVAMAATTAATAMVGVTDNNQLKGAWKSDGNGDGDRVYSQPDLCCPGPVKKGQKQNKLNYEQVGEHGQLGISLTFLPHQFPVHSYKPYPI
jgi:hypothetical protein